MARARPPDPRLVRFLSAYDPDVASLALALREIVLAEAPGAIESIYDAYNAVAIAFSLTGMMKDSFCHIATYTRHVNLGLNRGAALPDPQRILTGTGKSIRHIKIASERDLTRPLLQGFIRAAIAQAAGPSNTTAVSGESVVKGNYTKKRRPNLRPDVRRDGGKRIRPR